MLPMFTVEPATAQVGQGGSVTFTLTVKGISRNAVKWTVDEPNGGEISEDGRYLPPPRAGTYHVTAASTLDPQVTSRATVVVGG